MAWEPDPTNFTDLRYNYRGVAGGAVSLNRFTKVASDGEYEQATFNERIAGVLHSVHNRRISAAAGDDISIGLLRQTCVADGAVTPGQPIKSAIGGRAIQFVDSDLSGDTIEDNVGVEFTNQPANDGVEIVSSDAGDTTQTVTVYYTRNALGDTVYVQSGLALNGTTQVALTHTDVELVLAVEKSAATTGTITFREASGNATIVTLAAGTLSAGKIAVTAGQTRAYNTAPTAVAGGASTKQVGLIGTDENDAVLYDSQALNGTTPVTMNDTFKTVTFLLVGDIAAATTVTVKIGAEDNRRLYAGFALEAAAAKEDLFDAVILPGLAG